MFVFPKSAVIWDPSGTLMGKPTWTCQQRSHMGPIWVQYRPHTKCIYACLLGYTVKNEVNLTNSIIYQTLWLDNNFRGPDKEGYSALFPEISLLSITQTLCCGYSKESSHWNDSFEYLQYRVWTSNKNFRTWKMPLIESSGIS